MTQPQAIIGAQEGVWVTFDQAVDLTGLSRRTLRRKRKELGATQGAIGKNGKPQLMFPARRLPIQAQRGLALVGGTAIVKSDESAPPQRDFTKVETADVRLKAIAPLLDGSMTLKQAEHASDIPERTLCNWLKRFREGGYNALVDRSRKDKGERRVLNEDALAFLKSTIREYGTAQLCGASLFRKYEDSRKWRAHRAKRGDFQGPALPVLSQRTVDRWFEQEVPQPVKKRLKGRKAFYDSEEPVIHRDYDKILPMDYVVMDHRMLDIWCLQEQPRGGYKLFRPWITAALDMRTRKWLAWSLVETPSSDSIATVLKRVLLNFGVPCAVYWDNGKDFRCRWFEGDEEKKRDADCIDKLHPRFEGVLRSLDIDVTHSIPFNARAKNIEPNFRRLARMERELPVWCGNKPDTRPDTFDRVLLKKHKAWLKAESEERVFPTAEEVAALYDEFFQELNERPLEGPGMDKVKPEGEVFVSPNEKWNDLLPNANVRTADPIQVHFAFLKEPRKITVDQCEIPVKFGTRKYNYKLIADSIGLFSYNGQEVLVRVDPLDLETVAVYHHKAGFLGLAHNPELRGMGEEGFKRDMADKNVTRRMVEEAIAGYQETNYPAPDAITQSRQRAEIRALPQRAEDPHAMREIRAALLPAAIVAAEIETDTELHSGVDDGSECTFLRNV